MLKKRKRADESHSFSAPVMHVEKAILLNGQALIINGWSKKSAEDISKIELVSQFKTLDITKEVKRYYRSDLLEAFPELGTKPFGLLAAIDESSCLGGRLDLRICEKSGQTQYVPLSLEMMDWEIFGGYAQERPEICDLLIRQVANLEQLKGADPDLQKHLESLNERSKSQDNPLINEHVDDPSLIASVVEKVYPLGMGGLLVFGWCHTPQENPKSIVIHGGIEKTDNLVDQLIPLFRQDVVNIYRGKYPCINEWTGFCLHAPLPTYHGDKRLLVFDFGDKGEVCLRIPTGKTLTYGTSLVKEILSCIPDPRRMNYFSYDMFSKGLGKALESAGGIRPRSNGDIKEVQFGEAREHSPFSVIVPLYGRYDFLRYQLAQFVGDEELKNADLIYVVDDPSILDSTLEMAAKYHPLFEIPFRVAWSGENLGFSGANNMGARLARNDYLVLVNSDVMPSSPGWLSILKQALDDLPEAGAVGPLLKFYDGAIQHAGMYASQDPLFPGFILNSHKQVGMPWEEETCAFEVPMLTAACIMLEKSVYWEVGGLDEGYIVGDFEDSDLCLKIRKLGRRMWMVPEACLYHLERQSQNVSTSAAQRQLLTLFNGWRYTEKIRSGLLPDPIERRGQS